MDFADNILGERVILLGSREVDGLSDPSAVELKVSWGRIELAIRPWRHGTLSKIRRQPLDTSDTLN